MCKWTTYFILSLLFATDCFSQSKSKKINLDSSSEALLNYIKVRGSLDSTEETVFYASGNIYSFIPEQRSRLLFTFEMYNIARFIKNDTGYTMLSREILIYKNPKTNEILHSWINPFTKDTVEVIPVWNDPVNAVLNKDEFGIDYIRMSKNRICIYADIPLLYPSPLKKADWPKNSRSDWYQGAELFQFFFNESDAAKKNSKNIPCDISWTRFSDFLPWMQMSAQPGYLMYQSRGYKLQNGWKDLPSYLKEFVIANKPEYAHAPEQYSKPNMTSWKYFKKIMEENGKN